MSLEVLAGTALTKFRDNPANFPSAYERTVDGKRWVFTTGGRFPVGMFPVSAITSIRTGGADAFPGTSIIRTQGDDKGFVVLTESLPPDLRPQL
jgi:hypothetical protein